MRSRVVKEIITDAVSSNKLRYFELNEHQKHELAYELLKDDEQALIDADHDLTLQRMVADVIKRKGDYSSLRMLYSEIKKLFVDGNAQYDAHYAEKIDELLNEEWADKNASANEHFENDAMNRARDAQSAMRSQGY
jgi:hypothetical protein